MKISDAAKLGHRRLAHELREIVYLKTGLDLTTPVAVLAHPTERCNYRCLSCDCWRRESYPPEMTLEEWCAALTDLRAFIGPYNIQFAGGEPFVFKPFLSLVEWCAEHGIDWGVTTNGSAFSDANVRRLVSANPLNVDVSVDGANSAVHDHSRGIANSLKRIERGIASLRSVRDQEGRTFPIRIKTTVHRLNLSELPMIVEWVDKLGGTTVDFSPVRPWTPEVVTELWLGPDDEEQLQSAVQLLIAAKKAGAPIETEESRMAAWPAHFRNEFVKPDLAPCRVGLRDFHILPNGDVRSCWEYPVIGNLKTSSAREIWRGAVAAGQREEMMQCPNFGSPKCATSCLSHRTLGQDGKRMMLWLGNRTRRKTA